MELNLKGRTALSITGVIRGIGKAVALGLAAEGCHLHLAARNADTLHDLTATIGREFGVDVHEHVCDVADSASAPRLAAAAGAVDLLVNNAGAIHAAIWKR